MSHALPAGVVLPEAKIVYVPVPKAACTSMLWTLADVQDERGSVAAAAASACVIRALLVHEPAFWRHTTLLDALSDSHWNRLRSDDGWLIFSMTRHPVSRLWSAWQSKLLLREPRFVDAFGACGWFPRIPSSAGDVVADFRRFVQALAGDDALLHADRHWQPQVALLQAHRMGFTHVGRTSAYADTLGVVERHLRDHGWSGSLNSRRENSTLIGVDALGAVDKATREQIEALYAQDMTAYGYARGDDAARPMSPVDGQVAQQFVRAVREIVARHERLGDLLRLHAAGRP